MLLLVLDCLQAVENLSKSVQTRHLFHIGRAFYEFLRSINEISRRIWYCTAGHWQSSIAIAKKRWRAQRTQQQPELFFFLLFLLLDFRAAEPVFTAAAAELAGITKLSRAMSDMAWCSKGAVCPSGCAETTKPGGSASPGANHLPCEWSKPLTAGMAGMYGEYPPYVV